MKFSSITCNICDKVFSAHRAKGKSKPKYCSTKCYGLSKKGKPATDKQKEILLYWTQGERNCKWNGGGKTWWKKKIIERDGSTCQICKLHNETPGFLDAHHIKREADFPELKNDISNGITLCPNCHRVVTLRESHYLSRENSGRFKTLIK